MHLHMRRCLMGALLPALLAGCGPDYQPPDVKTNPNPKQRYAITVTLVDPPPGVERISGMTHFVPGTPCRPLVNSIAGVPVGASYQKAFALTRTADNTYTGHIYLDWPVDEDYYGLGVCKWELATARVYLIRSDYSQHVTEWGDDISSGPTSYNWWCPKQDSATSTRDCSRPNDEAAIQKKRDDHFEVVLTTQRN